MSWAFAAFGRSALVGALGVPSAASWGEPHSHELGLRGLWPLGVGWGAGVPSATSWEESPTPMSWAFAAFGRSALVGALAYPVPHLGRAPPP
jgi:hypothetical protein